MSTIMNNKKLFLPLIFMSFVQGSHPYNHIEIYEKSFKSEVKKGSELINKTKRTPYFKKALKELNKPSFNAKIGNKLYPKPNYELTLNYLSLTNTLFSSYVGIQLIKEVYLQKDRDINQKFGIFFSKHLSDNNVCSGHLSYGDILLSFGKENEALNAYNKGKYSCVGWIGSALKQKAVKLSFKMGERKK